MKMKFTLPLFTLLLLSALASAQPQNIKLSSSAASSVNEVSVAFNPQNTNELVVGANLRWVYASTDGGLTWSENKLASTLGERGDPVVVCDSSGNFFYVHIGSNGLVCQKAVGATGAWNVGAQIVPNLNKAQDKPWVSTDMHNDIIYTTWTQYDDCFGCTAGPTDSTRVFISHSRDKGATWSSPKRMNKAAGDCNYKDVVDPTPCLGQNGQIYVAWEDSSGILFNTSSDTGNTWMSSPVFVSTVPGAFYYKVPGIPFGRVRPDPVTACDLSNSVYRGNVYIVWSDQRNGVNNTDVFLVKSSDGGHTWNTPAKVNSDVTNTHQFFGNLTVDQSNGNIYVLFYDRRNFTDTLEVQTEVYMAQSKDGGATFTNYKMSQTPFICDSTVFIGDYIGIAAQNNQIRPIWTRNDNSATSIWTAIADASTLGIEELKKNGNLELEVSYPNPFREQTTIAFNLIAPTSVSMKVYDMYGKEVAQLLDRSNMETGNHKVVFDNRNYQLAPGIYFYSLSDGHSALSGKMALMK